VGLTGTCGGGDEGGARPFQLTLSGGVLTTPLNFGSVQGQRLDEANAILTFSDQIGQLSLEVGLGAILGGSLDGALGDYRLGAGPLVNAAAGWGFLDGKGPRPYLAAALSFGFSTVRTQNESLTGDNPQLTALDLRLSAVIGKWLFGFWLPYFGAAVFGGPVFFAPQGQSLTGTDGNHYRLSVGSTFDLPGHLRAFVEVGFLGEQNAVLGLGYAF
jgi:hypothetical protein